MEEQEIERGNTRLAVKVGFWYVLSTFLTKSMALITTPIFSRTMNIEAYGEFSNFASWRSIMLILIGLELYNTVPRAYYDYRGKFDRYVSSITIFSGLVTGICYIIYLAAKDFFFKIVVMPEELIHILFISILFASAKNIFLSRERTLYHYKSVIAVSFYDGIVPTIVSLIAVLSVSDNLKMSARVYGFYGASLVSAIICFIILIWRGHSFNWGSCIYAINLALPLQINYLTMYLLTNTNIIIAKNLMGSSASAVVSISTSVLNIVTILFQATNGAITTLLMDKLEQKKYREARRDSFFYIAFLAFIALGTILIAPEIVYILGDEKYAEATILLPALVAAAFIQAVVSVLTVILMYDKNVVKTAVSTGVVAVLSIIAKVILLSKSGVICLSYVNLVAAIILFVFNYSFVKEAGYRESFNLRGCLLLSGFILLIMFMSYYLYSYVIVRIILIGLLLVLFLIIAIKNKNKIKKLFRK